MTLTRHRIIDTAVSILRQYGLADLSMRRLARELDVQAGAIYWHIDSKQALLIEVAARLLEDVRAVGPDPAGADGALVLRDHLAAIRLALLSVPDASDVIELAYVLDPDSLPAIRDTPALVRKLGVSAADSEVISRVLVNHVLAAVAAQQIRDRQTTGLPRRSHTESPEACAFADELQIVLSAITGGSQAAG